MEKVKPSTLVLAIALVFLVVALRFPELSSAGSLEPNAAPGSTMKTLDQIPPTWSQKLEVSERFKLVLDDAAVLDKETGLVWARNANIADGPKTWAEAIDYCSDLTIANRKGWRLPTREEMSSLVDPSQTHPALPLNHPFDNVQNSGYYTITTYELNALQVWSVYMTSNGVALPSSKDPARYFWPVRGGSSPILVPHTP